MNDDWRLRVDVREAGIVHRLLARLDASELQHDLETAFHDRVIVSLDGSEVFCYAGTREQAERAERVIRSHAEDHGWQISTELRRWHPAAEEWQDPDKPLPRDDAELLAERAELMTKERAESQARGFPDYEVRVTLADRERAAQLARRLRDEGLPSVQRANYLLIGALDEDSANALAERVRELAPPESTVSAEASLGAVVAETGGNPFALMGGLAG